MHPRAQQLIEILQLQAHPEGGFYREVYLSELQVHSTVVGELRAAATDIYFLLPAGQLSRWHRVAHDELWNFYEGAPLTIHQLSPDFSVRLRHQLDPQVGQFKQLVPAGHWQAAESSGDYTLVGCSVAPGFDFEDFCMLRNLPESAAKVFTKYPELSHFV
jgi:predicted cupin superfamily sugar epimerase